VPSALPCHFLFFFSPQSLTHPPPHCSYNYYSNMGFYTGMDVTKDTIINYPEIVVPLLFRSWGDHPEGYSDGVLW
jgi:hypothetical protein